jgi:hypothetical protein
MKECTQPIFSPHCPYNHKGDCDSLDYCTYQREKVIK